jgi:hypothetical protein
MWPMSDFEAVVFIMTVALLVALAQVGVTWLPLTHAAGSPGVSGTANDILEQHKGPVDGEQPGPLAPLASRQAAFGASETGKMRGRSRC